MTAAGLPVPPAYRVFVFGGRPSREGAAGSFDPPRGVPEPVAIDRVLQVTRVVASRLFEHWQQPPLEERQRGAEDLLDQIILQAAALRTSPSSPLPLFETRIKDALSTCAWWQSGKIPAPTVPTESVAPDDHQTGFTVEDVAVRLGVHHQTVRQWIRNRKLEAIRVGRILRIRKADFDRFCALKKSHNP